MITLEQITAAAEEAGIKVRKYWVTDNIPVESLVTLYTLGAESRDAEIAELRQQLAATADLNEFQNDIQAATGDYHKYHYRVSNMDRI